MNTTRVRSSLEPWHIDDANSPQATQKLSLLQNSLKETAREDARPPTMRQAGAETHGGRASSRAAWGFCKSLD
jgi:hypothetical protein